MSYSSKPATNALDILILQDFTGSQIPYIDSIRRRIDEISNTIQTQGGVTPEDIRYGLVAFRDHPPQDDTFVTKVFPFSTKPGALADSLASLSATGGGDGPECQSDALADTLNAQWKDGATKVAILITDSPPHGIGEDGDGFPNGCPAKFDPVQIASKMASVGITLYVLACEPTLSQYYKRARDFYVGLTKITGGKVYDLGDSRLLPSLISGTVIEALDTERLVTKYVDEVRSLAKNYDSTPDTIADKLLSKLEAEEVTQHVLVVDDMHVENSEKIEANIDVWFKAKSTAEARNKIQEVQEDRIAEDFLAGGLQSAPEVQESPINLAQVQNIVQKCLLRK